MNKVLTAAAVMCSGLAIACGQSGQPSGAEPMASTATSAGHAASTSAAGSGMPITVSTSTGAASAAGRGGTTSTQVAAGHSAPATSTMTPPAQTPPSAASSGSTGANSGGAGAAGSLAAGAGAAGVVASAAAGSGTAGSAAMAGSSQITGTLGALGPVQPILAGWATTNGLETLIYLSTAPLTCAMMMTRGTKWLSTLPAKSEVLEIVVGQPSSVKTYTIGTAAAFGGGEVNYAEGSKSSATEVTGSAGTITLTTANAMGVHEGMIDVTAPYMASGKFHAEWCQGGTEY
jgi:hypothetical protein